MVSIDNALGLSKFKYIFSWFLSFFQVVLLKFFEYFFYLLIFQHFSFLLLLISVNYAKSFFNLPRSYEKSLTYFFQPLDKVKKDEIFLLVEPSSRADQKSCAHQKKPLVFVKIFLSVLSIRYELMKINFAICLEFALSS